MRSQLQSSGPGSPLGSDGPSIADLAELNLHLETKLLFADNSFDYVTAFHTVTVVPDPIRMLVEAKRVCRPGGKIVIINHFTTDHPIIGPLTEALDPVTRHLGWQTKLRLKPFLQATDFNVEEIYKLSKLSLYTVIVGAKEKEERCSAGVGPAQILDFTN